MMKPITCKDHDLPKLRPDTGRIYPCAECGIMRTKDEGGTTFTVCDDCWDRSRRDEDI